MGERLPLASAIGKKFPKTGIRKIWRKKIEKKICAYLSTDTGTSTRDTVLIWEKYWYWDKQWRVDIDAKRKKKSCLLMPPCDLIFCYLSLRFLDSHAGHAAVWLN